MGGLIISTMHSQTKNKILNIKTLKKDLLLEIKSPYLTQFFCTHKLKKCFFLSAGEIIKYDGKLEIGKNVKIYKIDKQNSIRLIEDFGIYKSDKVSFLYNIFPNKSSSQMIIKNDDGIFYIPTYFKKVTQVESLEDAQSLWIKDQYDLHDESSYY